MAGKTYAEHEASEERAMKQMMKAHVAEKKAAKPRSASGRRK